MPPVRSKSDPIDSVAEQAVRLLNVARLFESGSSAVNIFKQIRRFDDFVQSKKPDEPDVAFRKMAVDFSRQLIDYASDLDSLARAQDWVTRNRLVHDGDSTGVLAVLTLIHAVNRGVKLHPKDETWARMKERVDKLKPVPQAA
ncbi:MAG: hypothetical protein QOJ98_15 [Acidobacteriota bacterium]|jgi:hypothetical protein|nr:hypothetical protein [Acidobacteriota bacterium]